jgi:hypothetical protein
MLCDGKESISVNGEVRVQEMVLVAKKHGEKNREDSAVGLRRIF